jgi:hypothetical protein
MKREFVLFASGVILFIAGLIVAGWASEPAAPAMQEISCKAGDFHWTEFDPSDTEGCCLAWCRACGAVRCCNTETPHQEGYVPVEGRE